MKNKKFIILIILALSAIILLYFSTKYQRINPDLQTLPTISPLPNPEQNKYTSNHPTDQCLSKFTNNQNSETEYQINLNNQPITPEANYSRAITCLMNLTDQPYYGIVQLFEPPTQQQRSYLNQQGIQLLGYLPQKTWIAKIKPSLTFNHIELSSLIRYIGPIPVSSKLSSHLWNNQIPKYIIEGNQLKLTVVYHDLVKLDQVTTLVQQYSAEILSETPDFNFINISVDRQNLPSLAAENIIIYIEPVPPPQTTR